MTHALIHAVTNAAYGDHPRQRLDVFCPQPGAERPLLVCLHGGWWHEGKKEDLRALALHLAEGGHPTATLGYRLLGDDGVGDGRDLVADVEAAVVRAMEEASIEGAHHRAIYLLGCNSGAVLALLAAARLQADEHVLPLGVVACAAPSALTPWEGCPPAVAEHLRAFIGQAGAELDHAAIPIERHPPILQLHGDHDEVIPARIATALYRRGKDADEGSRLAVLAGLGHRFLADPFTRGAHGALEHIRAWLDRSE